MAKTTNYEWDLPSPKGIQLAEIAKIATTFSAIDIKVKSFEAALSTHKHAFDDLTKKPTTLDGYGITDGMTAAEVAAAIKAAVDALLDGSVEALDTLKELGAALGNDPDFAATVSAALGLRVRVDAATTFTLAQKAQGRANIDALGSVDRGAAGGVASLDSGGKVPTAQLPALTTTSTVGAAIAGANGKATPADGDFFAGVEAGGSTMFKTTWANIKAALASLFVSRSGSVMTGELNSLASIGYRLGGGAGKSTFFHKNDVDFYIMISDTPTGSFNAYRPFAINLASGRVSMAHGLTVSGGIQGTASWATNASWADGATYADRLGPGGWTLATIQDQLNWRVTDTRFDGYLQQEMRTTGGTTSPITGASGYVVTAVSKRNVEVLDIYSRQPQRYIPNQGWRALGGW